MSEPTYYELLGVSRDATSEQIKRAYRERMKQCHPDMVARRLIDDEGMDENTRGQFERQRSQAEETAKLINQAYSVLSDAARRRQYDVLLNVRTHTRATRQQPPRHSNASRQPDHQSDATHTHPGQRRWRISALRRLANLCIQATIFAAVILFEIALAALALFISIIVIAVLYALVLNLPLGPYQELASAMFGLAVVGLYPVVIGVAAKYVFRK